MSQTVAAPRSGQKRLLWLMVALFALPVVTVLLLFAIGWKPDSARPNGELLEASPLPLTDLRDLEGRPVSSAAVSGRWLLLVASAGQCDDGCRQRVDEVRRIHVALNKNMERVKRVWLTGSPESDPALQALPRAFPDLIAARPASAGWTALLPGAGTQVYVIDPAGRPVLRYAGSAEARGILKDVDRLLRYSWVG